MRIEINLNIKRIFNWFLVIMCIIIFLVCLHKTIQFEVKGQLGNIKEAIWMNRKDITELLKDNLALREAIIYMQKKEKKK